MRETWLDTISTRGARRLIRPLLLPATMLAGQILGATGASAQAQTPLRTWQATTDSVTVDASIGIMNGTAREYVLNPNGSMLSKLTWDIKNVAMFQAGLAYRPLDWLTLGLKGATNLSGASFMHDYDYNLPQCPPLPGGGSECHSSHPDTTLRNAFLVDAFAAARFLRLGPVELSAIAGYKADYYYWQAIGGTLNYAAPTPGNGISYAQMWRAPYLGLGMQAEFGRWSLHGRFIASVWATVTGVDNHHNRALLFTDRLGPSQMMAAELGLGYRLNDTVTLTADYRYQAWRIAQGPSTEDRMNGSPPIVYRGKSSGASNHSHTVSVGLRFAPLASRGGTSTETGFLAPVSWSGAYGGAAIGSLWQDAGWTTTGHGTPPGPVDASSASRPFNAGAPRAGLFAGYLWQAGNWLYGIEADVGLANANRNRRGIPGSNTPALLNASGDETGVLHGWDASLRGRLGAVITPNLMVYATAGMAFQRATVRASCTNGYACSVPLYESFAQTQAGWTVGAGVETALADNWFARAEYRYAAFPTLSHTFFAASPTDSFSVRVSQADHRASLAIGYRY
ncbi:MAG: omptin family outer membrane protease [Phreatobacter sp.]